MDGDVDLKIPSGVQPGTTLVMGKRGVPRLGGSGRGDHMVSICHLPLCSGAWQPGWLAHACGHHILRFSLEVSGLLPTLSNFGMAATELAGSSSACSADVLLCT